MASDTEFGESVLLVSLIALPLIAFVVVRVMHGGLLNRYAMAATFGVVLGIAGLLSVTRRRAVAAFAIFVLVSVGVRELRFWHHGGHDPFVAGLWGPDRLSNLSGVAATRNCLVVVSKG